MVGEACSIDLDWKDGGAKARLVKVATKHGILWRLVVVVAVDGGQRTRKESGC